MREHHRVVTDGEGKEHTGTDEPRSSSRAGTPADQHGRICRQVQGAEGDLADIHLGFSAGENTTDNRWTTLYDGIPQAHGQPPVLPPGGLRLYGTAPPTDTD
jgi:hypothetical protein